MSRVSKINFGHMVHKVLTLTGGLNEQVSSLERKPGELFECRNYEEIDGEYHGYRSVPGFERYDGRARLQESPVGSGTFIPATYPSDVPVEFDVDGTVGHESDPLTILDELGNVLLDEDGDAIVTETYVGDVGRESIREQIDPCPGTGPLLAVFEYREMVYAIREEFGGTGFTGMFIADETFGWTRVDEWPTDVPVNDVYTNPIRFSKGRLTFWPTLNPGRDSIFITNGLYFAIAMNRNTDGIHTIEAVDSEYLPDGTDNPDIQEEYAYIPLVWNQRLFLAYPTGYLFYGNLGDITFNPVVGDGFAGNWVFGSEITDLVQTPGDGVVCWMEKGVQIIKGIQGGDTAALGDMIVETWSDRSGSTPNTATRFLGTMIFLDDRGVSTMDTSDVFGDFQMASISKKVQATLEARKDSVLRSFVNRWKNQYILLFTDGSGLTFTFDVEKAVKGATFFNYAHTFTCGDSDTLDDDSWLLLGDNAGYVQVMRDNAASRDGDEIDTALATSYYNYGTPENFKTFVKLLFEFSGDKGTVLHVRADYDYSQQGVPKSQTLYPIVSPAGAQWGTAIWGEFIWSGSPVDQEPVYITGVGTNMSINIASNDKYRKPHTIHNAITTFSKRATKF